MDWFRSLSSGSGSATPLHVDVAPPKLKAGGINVLPVVSTVFKLMPATTKTNMLLKTLAPSSDSVPDWYDQFKENPYNTVEVVEDKIWRVEYKMVDGSAFKKDGKAISEMMGMDFTKEECCQKAIRGAESLGPRHSEQVLKDIEKKKELQKMIAEQGKTDDTVKAVGANPVNMIVVKLNSGDIMLYSPIQVREEFGFADWLDGLGPVKWIVCGSSSHTLQMPIVVKRYPNAQYVAAKEAWSKLTQYQGFQKEKLDFDSTNKEDLNRLNEIMEKEGAKFFTVDGDVSANACIVVVHKTALEADVIYSTSNDGGKGCFGLSEDEFFSEDLYKLRMFRWASLCKPNSPNGALPAYRFWGMDPANPLSLMNLTSPKKDGSSCKDMATSLREVLKEDIEQACGAHINYMSGEDFKKSVDLNWNWLDGQSLLP